MKSLIRELILTRHAKHSNIDPETHKGK